MFDFLWRSERESNPHLSPLKSGECSIHCHYPAMMSRGFLCVFCDECRCYLHPTTHWGEVGCCLLLTIKIFRVATLSFRFVLQSKPAVTSLVKPEGVLVSALSLGTIIL